jgi:hypothetical protein
MINQNKCRVLAVLFTTLFSAGCMSNNQTMPPYYGEQNKSNGFFMESVIIKSSLDLDKMIENNWYFTADIKHKTYGEKSVNNCPMLIEAVNGGYEAQKEFEQGSVDAQYLICLTWQEMKKFKASKTSYLGNITFDKAFAKQAPARLSLIISNDDERKAKTVESWNAMSEIQRVEKVNDEQAVYYDNGGSIQRVTLMAKGDYNEDGIEDMLLYMENSVKGGSYSSSYSYILTRLTATGPFSLLKEM